MTCVIKQGDSLEVLKRIPDQSVQLCVSSPPFWGLRAYLDEDDPHRDFEVGQEGCPEAYVAKLVAVFHEVKRVLKDDGLLYVNIGDGYVGGNNTDIGGNANFGNDNGVTRGSQVKAQWKGLPPKNRLGMPHRVVFALQQDDWIWRDEVVWSKGSTMPSSVKDRTTCAHEFMFMLSKSPRYFYNAEAIAEPALTPNDDFATRNKRSVWLVNHEYHLDEDHPALMPQGLIEPAILAGSNVGDVVLDPFAGICTVGIVALRHGRRFLGIELSKEFAEIGRKRVLGPMFAGVE